MAIIMGKGCIEAYLPVNGPSTYIFHKGVNRTKVKQEVKKNLFEKLKVRYLSTQFYLHVLSSENNVLHLVCRNCILSVLQGQYSCQEW